MKSVQSSLQPLATRCRFCLFSCLTLAIASSAMGQSDRAAGHPKTNQTAPDAAADEQGKVVVRVYPVDDLLIVPGDYPLPIAISLGGAEPRWTVGGMGGGMGGGMRATGTGGAPAMGGGMGGGGHAGGGMFSVVDPQAAPEILRQFGGGGGMQVGNLHPAGQQPGGGGNPHAAAQQAFWLTRLIKGYVKGDWDSGEQEGEWGDSGQCTVFGKNLIVRQTEAAQQRVADLLQALRSGGSSVRSVTVEATWLALDPSERDALQAAPADSAHGTPGASVSNLKRFRELARETAVFRGRIACLNGQRVHLTTGSRRVISSGATPTVGVGAVGYSAITGVINVGAVLQVTPSISGDRHSAFVDVQSAVTHWRKPDDPIKVTSQSFPASSDKSVGGPLKQELISIDRPNVGTQEWSTTTSIPLDVPVLVGSATLTDSSDDATKLVASSRPELSLFIEIHAN